MFLSLVTVTSFLKPSTAFSMPSSNYGTQIDRIVAPDYNTVGNILILKDDTEFYATGTARGKRGVILISDILGWNSGRIRNIADFSSETTIVWPSFQN